MEQHNKHSTASVLESLSMKSTVEAKLQVAATQVGDVKIQQLLEGLINLDSLHLLKSSLSDRMVPEVRTVHTL